MSRIRNSAAHLVAVAGLSLVGLVVLPVPTAMSQPPAKAAAFESYAAVVTADKAPMLCMAADNGYTVSELPKGMVVRVVGQQGGWLKVLYPPRMTAFVKAADATQEGDNIKLSKSSKLWAANPLRGFDGSWKALMDNELAIGTTLKLADVVPGADGKTAAFRVFAPDGASGWVDPKSVRRATDDEAARLGAVPAPAHSPATPTTPAAAPTGTTTSPTPTTLAEPMSPTGAAPKIEPGAVLPRPQNPDGSTGTPPTGAPGGQSPATDLRPIEVAPSPAGVAAVEARKQKAAALETLESKFQSVTKQAPENAEYDEISAELRRAIDQEEPGSRRAKQLQLRLDFVELRKDFRDKLRAAEDARASLDATDVKVREELAAIERTRVYTIIGTLAPSTVYDGKELPLMYRIQSVGGVSPRTLGYIKPNKDFDLDRKLGQVVGVIGASEIDRALKLNIVTPVRVDVLRASGFSTVSPGVAVPVREGTPAVNPDGAQVPATPTTPAQPQVPEPTDK